MRKIFSILLLLVLEQNLVHVSEISIVIHGGAGTILRENLSDQQEQLIRADLQAAVEAGYQVLANGGDSTKAIIAAIVVMENSPNFNAGKGAVYTKTAEHELDASIMRGNDLQAGAVAGVRHVKNPILAAQAVMLHSPHVMLAGKGADEFAKSQNLEWVENKYFDTEARYKSWQKAHKTRHEKAAVTEDNVINSEFKFGTVGAVAIDKKGNIAAGTSTGGMTYKAYNRIGDSPVIGAGTYADNRSCGISATGHGEFFIRYAVAHDICARVRYQGVTLEVAAKAVIMGELKKAGGDGGIVGLDSKGKPVMIFNTAGMYRAYKNSKKHYIGIYADE